jgi:acetylornithine deacetylase/succinyl-diaminopimelate desuccinylase-like protein
MLLDDLRQLCALPTVFGQRDELSSAAQRIALMMRQHGLHTDVFTTPGAPVVVGQRTGRSPWTLLLYHHYDVAPPGPWRAWHHDPFQLAERDGALYGRGVAAGKGPFVAHLAAIQAMLATADNLPCSVLIVAEGEGLLGSPHLSTVVRDMQDQWRVDGCLASGGERNAAQRPICYGGAKGMLQVRLTTIGANQPLAAGLGVSVPNPLWRLIWALHHIKSDQEEILIEGFYDTVEGPRRSDNKLLREAHLDESGRLSAWGLGNFLFESTGVGLVRTESTLPTCNVSSLVVEPQSEVALIPVAATAQLDFQLVPQQSPQAILDLLREHLAAKEFADVDVERLPGGYGPAATLLDDPFVQQLSKAGNEVFGTPFDRLPLGPFAQPLHIFTEAFNVPVASLGCLRPYSAINGPNEHILLDDLVRHAQVLMEFMTLLGNQQAKGGDHESAVGAT